ncbi:hypothetical protein K4F52_007339 [Lecanicillium sp. MT-2017a]|nr:hypothetical protein K4F52_007339 [Lecanicillium sp. MT-2017a]
MASRTDARLMKSTKFPPEFSKKVDMQKVNLQVMKKWIASRVSEILGNEDDVVIELCFNLVEGPRYPDIKAMQIQLTGFLDKDTAPFCKELWKLFLSAQDSPQGVPKELLEAKKLELMQEKTIRVADLVIPRAVDETALVITTANGETNHATEQTIGMAAATTAASTNEDEAHTQGPTSAHGHLRLDTGNRGILIPQTVTCPVVARIVMIPEDADAGRTDRRGLDLLAHRGLPRPVAGETLLDENSTRARGRGLVPLVPTKEAAPQLTVSEEATILQLKEQVAKQRPLPFCIIVRLEERVPVQKQKRLALVRRRQTWWFWKT